MIETMVKKKNIKSFLKTKENVKLNHRNQKYDVYANK